MEGATQSMVLDDVDADTFGVVVNWIYTQRILDASNGVPSLCESLIFFYKNAVPLFSNISKKYNVFKTDSKLSTNLKHLPLEPLRSGAKTMVSQS
jgi:hypothetical protein